MKRALATERLLCQRATVSYTRGSFLSRCLLLSVLLLFNVQTSYIRAWQRTTNIRIEKGKLSGMRLGVAKFENLLQQ